MQLLCKFTILLSKIKNKINHLTNVHAEVSPPRVAVWSEGHRLVLALSLKNMYII